MNSGYVGQPVLDMVVWLKCGTCNDVTPVRVQDSVGKRACPPLDFVIAAPDGIVDVDAWLTQEGQGTAVSILLNWTCPLCGDAHKTEIIGR